MTNGNKWSDETHYFIIQSDNKRFKFLYFNGTNVGTRRTLGLKMQRAIDPELNAERPKNAGKPLTLPQAPADPS